MYEKSLMCVAGLVQWSSSDWQSKLRQTLRSTLEGQPEPAVEARPLGPLSQAGMPALPSMPLGQVFAVLEALLNLAERQRLHNEPSSTPQSHRDRWEMPLNIIVQDRHGRMKKAERYGHGRCWCAPNLSSSDALNRALDPLKAMACGQNTSSTFLDKFPPLSRK